jgi:hypothetical protein
MHFDQLKRRDFIMLLGGAAVTTGSTGWPRLQPSWHTSISMSS